MASLSADRLHSTGRVVFRLAPHQATKKGPDLSESGARHVGIKSRARSGCNTCRKRKIKCDEGHPACRRCIRSRLSCGYQLHLQWEQDMVASGKCHGRSGVWSKTSKKVPQTPQSASTTASAKASMQRSHTRSVTPLPRHGHSKSHIFVNTSTSDMQFLSRLQDGCAKRYRSLAGIAITAALEPSDTCLLSPTHAFETLSPQSLPSSFPWKRAVPDYDPFLLSYFETVICATSTLVDDIHCNPLRSLILPTAAVSKLAYYGLLMLAAHYLQLVDPRYYQAEMELRQMTLTKVRRAMTGSRWCDDDVFVTVMILCSHDISLHCDSTWLVHLKYYREYLVWRIRHPGLASARSPLAHYAASYFAAHTVLAKSLFSIADSASPAALALLDRTFDSCNTWTSTEFISSFMSTESLNEIDPWNGYSNSLLLLINEIACLREDAVAMHHHRLSQARIEAKIRLLETSLSRLSQSSPASLRNTDQQTLSHQRRLLEGNAEAYRLAAILFLNESSSPRFLGLATTNDAGPAIPLLDATKQQQYVSGVLERVRDIVMHTDLPVSWPLWPLFIAGCRTDAEEDRMTVLSLLQCAQRKKQYENIPRAQKVIELVWQHQDTQLDNDFGKKYQRPGTVGRYEWEVIMDLKGWRPSLA